MTRQYRCQLEPHSPVVPRVEALLREIERDRGVSVVNVARGNTPGGVSQLGVLIAGMPAAGLDENWKRSFALLLTDGEHGLNRRNAASIKVRENSLRRLAERRGYRLVKSRSGDPRATDFGRYKIVETATGAVVAGEDGRGGCAYSFGEAEENLAAARPPQWHSRFVMTVMPKPGTRKGSDGGSLGIPARSCPPTGRSAGCGRSSQEAAARWLTTRSFSLTKTRPRAGFPTTIPGALSSACTPKQFVSPRACAG
jgi:hypothetical protein